MTGLIAEIVNATVLVLTIAIIIRALMSWFPNIDARNPLVEFLFTITEPILAPIRKIMPRMPFDFTPMIAVILLQVLQRVIIRYL